MKSLSVRWKPIAGWEGWYEVSDLGHVKRVRAGRGGNTHIGRILKGRVGAPGYLEVVLHRKPERRTVLVHRLVAEAFVERPSSNVPLEVNHIDGDKSNNMVANLEWVTSSENQRHSIKMGLRAVGENHVNAKLSQADVLAIRAEYKPHVNGTRLAAKYGVSLTTICKVGSGQVRLYD